MKQKQNNVIYIGIALFVVGVFVWGARSGPATHSSESGSASLQGVSGASGETQQGLAPDFTLQKLGGENISLADYRGKKPVVVDFWASWCPNCRRDLPHLNRFYEKYKDQVEVIAVNLQEDEGTVGRFVSSNSLSFPVALDPQGSASRAYNVQYTNFHVLINKDGEIVKTIPGDISEADFQSLL